MKMNVNMKIRVLAILIVVLFSTVSCASNTSWSMGTYKEKFSEESISNVDISLKSESVQLNVWGKDYFWIKCTSSTSSFPKVELISSTLSISTQRYSSGKVEVFIPASFYAESPSYGYKIETVSGSIYAAHLWGCDIDINTVSGSVKLEKCEAPTLELETTSGSITIDGFYAKNRISLETVSGSIAFFGSTDAIDANSVSGSIRMNFETPLYNTSNIKNVSGTIRLALSTNSNFKIRFETISGNFKNDFTGYSGGKKGVDSYGSGMPLINVETLSGSIHITEN